ncbi:MAG: DUF2147 domain-containing protein [Candidatus Marinimicrobia bacterium]|nr:DUF2147 domain-containing protein [Candidatus Neomarinimicrobiota bacterium]
MNNTKLIILTFSIITTLMTAQEADKLIGKYRLPNQLEVELYKVDDKYFGKIIGFDNLDDESQLDINNPDKALRGEPLLGKIIIENLSYDQTKNEWVNGSMYGPEKGLIFNLRITDIRENEIEVVGSKYFLWKTLVWQKL